MPLSFAIGNANAKIAGTAGGKAPSAQSEDGVFMGRRVSKSDDAVSLITEASEDMAFSDGAPDADAPDCDLSDWDEDDDDAGLASEELEKAREEYEWSVGGIDHIEDKEGRASLRDRIRQYKLFMGVPDFDKGVAELGRLLASGAGTEKLLDKTTVFFPDETDAWVALYTLLEETRKTGASPALIRALHDALASLEGKNARRILAGLNGALASSGFEEAGDASTLRDAYRHTVCDFAGIMEAFSFIKTKFQNKFETAMDFLFAAISADMASNSPSMEMTHLAAVHGNLGKVRLLQSAYEECGRLVRRWESVHGVKNAVKNGFTAMLLLEKVMLLKEERFLGAMHIEEIAAHARIPDIEREVLFYQELLTTARAFPIALMDDDAGRLKVLSAIQECVDKAVEKEDAWLAEQESRGDA